MDRALLPQWQLRFSLHSASPAPLLPNGGSFQHGHPLDATASGKDQTLHSRLCVPLLPTNKENHLAWNSISPHVPGQNATHSNLARPPLRHVVTTTKLLCVTFLQPYSWWNHRGDTCHCRRNRERFWNWREGYQKTFNIWVHCEAFALLLGPKDHDSKC